MRRMERWHGTALLATLAVGTTGLLAAPAAVAAPESGWSEPVAVSGPDADALDLEVATVGGRGLAAWIAATGEETQVLTSRQQPDGSWSTPAPVASSGGAVEVEVAPDKRGRARLVWTADRRVLTAHQRSNGSTSGARLLHRTTSGALGTRPTDLRLAGSPTGAAVVSWQTTDDDEGPPIAGSEVRVMVRGGDGWGRARRLSSPGATGVAADVFVSRKGRATAVWREKARGPWSVRRATYRPRAGWTKARSFTGRGARAGTPRLAGRPAGRLTVAYALRSGKRRGLAVRQWSGRKGWSRPVVVRGARMRSRLDVGVTAKGTTAVFTDRRGGVRVVQVSRAGKVARSRLEPAGEVFDNLRLAVNRAGDTLVAWDSLRGGDHPIEAAYRSAAGIWGPLGEITAGGDSFLGAVTMRWDGEAQALWTNGEVGTDSFRVWARSYRAATPEQSPQCDISARGIPSCGAYAGATYGSNDDPRAMESQTGHRLGVRRTFWQANQVGPAVRSAKADIADGRLPWISFKLPKSWEEMAAGAGDTWANRIARKLGRLKGPVWVAFHHEPEKDGDIRAWTAMQERLGPIVRTSPNVGFTVITTGWNQWYGPAEYRIESLWPQTTVDVAGFDVYNRHLSVDRDGTLITAPDNIKATYFDKISAWAEQTGVAWGLAETGQTDESFAVDPGWMQRTFGQLEETGGVAMAYFNTPLNNYGSSWPLASREKQRAWGSAQTRGVLPRPAP